jgi:DNA-binding transcriptional LysR family regulator
MRLNLRHLEAATIIARRGGISAAAPVVNLSQPALTQAIAKLETQLGHALFDRLPTGMVPTPAGVLMLPRIERAMALLAEAVRQVRRPGRAGGAPPARLITLAQLRAVIAVERAGSYVLAAAAAGVSEPSLHRAAGELEAVLGARLLERDGRTVRATAAARRFVRPARLALAELQAGLDELAAIDAASAGAITIGAMPLARAGLVPRTVALFCAAHPAARLRILEGPYAELLAGLRAGEIDVLIGALREPLPSRDIAQETLFEDWLTIAAAARHPLAGRGAIPPAAARAYPWVMAPAGTPLRARWEGWFTAAGLAPPEVAVECSSVVAIRGLLLEGDWLTLLSPDQFRIEREAGLLAALGPRIEGSLRRIGLTTRADWQPTRLQRDFVAMLRQVSAARPPGIE